MDEIIHFRTRFSREKGIGSASKFTAGRSSEATEIRNVIDFDDARDIVWKKSTGTNIYKKNRLVNTAVDVTLVLQSGIYDREKIGYIGQIRACLESSCHFTGDTFLYLDTQKEPLSKIHTLGKNRLVIIVTSSIDIEEYKKMAGAFAGNDIVFLMLYHPFEIEPVANRIFESHIPNKRYYSEMDDRIHTIQKGLHSSGISNILLRTNDNIVLKLNHFFKYRYG